MNVLSFFHRPRSAPVARERLQLLLAHERFLGTIHPRHAVEKDVTDHALFSATSLEGEQVRRAVARSKVSGWSISPITTLKPRSYSRRAADKSGTSRA